MVAHSMCQPGRPGPRSPPSQAGSPSRAPRHSSGSSGSRLPGRSGSPPRSADSTQHLVAGQVGLVAERAAPPRSRSRRRRCRRRAGTPRRPSSSSRDVRGDRRDRLDRADVVRRRDDPQRLHVLAEQRGLAHRQDHPVLAVAGGALQQRVVDVGDVLHVAHVVAGVAPGRLTRSNVIIVAAWPRWVASYGRDAADVHRGGRAGRGRAAPTGGPSRTARGGVAVARQGRHVVPGPSVHGRQPSQPADSEARRRA